MGIKKVRTATYISDSGKEFDLAEMTSSHILNVIIHHQKQLEAVLRCPGFEDDYPFLFKREQSLRDTIAVLYAEIATRDPDKDEEIQTRFKNNDY